VKSAAQSAARSASKIAARALGVYAGLVALEHGVAEILQGDVAPAGLIFNAIGPPCEAETVWHACLPAMTVLPSLLAAGVLTVAVSLIVIIWSIGFSHRKRGGLGLILLSIAMLLLGGGFVAPFTGLVAGATASSGGRSLAWLATRLPDRVLRGLAALWPWALVAVAIWFPAGWVLGHVFGRVMLSLSALLFLVFDLGLPVLTVLSGLACDARGCDPAASPRSAQPLD
jgi:hypothetical protein